MEDEKIDSSEYFSGFDALPPDDYLESKKDSLSSPQSKPPTDSNFPNEAPIPFSYNPVPSKVKTRRVAQTRSPMKNSHVLSVRMLKEGWTVGEELGILVNIARDRTEPSRNRITAAKEIRTIINEACEEDIRGLPNESFDGDLVSAVRDVPVTKAINFLSTSQQGETHEQEEQEPQTTSVSEVQEVSESSKSSESSGSPGGPSEDSAPAIPGGGNLHVGAAPGFTVFSQGGGRAQDDFSKTGSLHIPPVPGTATPGVLTSPITPSSRGNGSKGGKGRGGTS